MHEVTLPAAALITLFALCGVLGAFAYHLGFFVPLHRRLSDVLPLQAIGAFGIFLFLQLLLLPLGTYFLMHLMPVDSVSHDLFRGWYQIFSILFVAACLWIYTKWLGKGARWFERACCLRNLLLGSLSWLVAFPVIILLTQVMGVILHDWMGYEMHTQLAVNQVQSVKEYPALLAVLVVCLITVVPFIEEVLFRGYLQESLQPFFRPWPALIITALVFALFHFSFTQGVSNFLILGALFVLALLLGYLKERQASLWSSLALHATFNGISLVQILMIE